MNKFKIIACIFFILILLMACAGYYLFYTTKGVETIVSAILTRNAAQEDIQYKNMEGTLVQGVNFENLALTNVKYLPPKSTLKIQKLFVNLTSLGVDGLVIRIENARLLIPGSNPVVLDGALENEILNLVFYGKGVDIENLLSGIPEIKKLPVKLAGSIDHIHLNITGEYTDPEVNGEFQLSRINVKGIQLTTAEGTLALRFKELNNDLKIFGEIAVTSGEVISNRTLVKVLPSKVYFDGLPHLLTLNLAGTSKIDRTDINISLKGTVEEPQLKLTSNPALPQERLMLMLATGKNWKGLDDSLEQKGVSFSLTKDFVDYFFFAGRGNGFAQKFGLSDLSVNVNKNERGISAKKDLTNKLQVGYGIDQQTTETGTPGEVTQKLQGQIKMTDRLSVDIESDIKQKKELLNELNDDSSNINNKVYLKYKKAF